MKRHKKRKADPRAASREAVVERKTRETSIRALIRLDGRGLARVKTGLGFLDHMLELVARHGLFDLEVTAKGDLHVDRHHTNEDVAITLGQAFAKALGDKKGIARYGFFYVPMGESLARVTLDICGRPSLYFSVDVPLNQRGEAYKVEDAEHFLESFGHHAGLNMHVEVLKGRQHHHVIEAVFKAFARALSQASRIDPRESGIPSTKGLL